jgi:hypothetical protein
MGNKLYSPNELFVAGKQLMLNDVEPQNGSDWVKLVHFWAANINTGSLPEAVEQLCIMYRAPIKKELVLKISNHYRDLALKKQEEELKKIIGKPVNHAHLKHLRSIISKNVEYGNMIQIFHKAKLPEAWPHHDNWESWGKLCNALFLMSGSGYKTAQKEMLNIINGDK